MNLRIAVGTKLKPSETHISDAVFKHIKMVKTFRHMSMFQWTRYEGGIYLTKGRRIYKFLMYQEKSSGKWSYNILNISYASQAAPMYTKLNGASSGMYDVKAYLNYLIDEKFVDFIFVTHTTQGVIELTDAIHNKKYKVARKKYELKISAKELREKAAQL